MIIVLKATKGLDLTVIHGVPVVSEMMAYSVERPNMEEEQGSLGNLEMDLVPVECGEDVKVDMEREIAKRLELLSTPNASLDIIELDAVSADPQSQIVIRTDWLKASIFPAPKELNLEILKLLAALTVSNMMLDYVTNAAMIIIMELVQFVGPST